MSHKTAHSGVEDALSSVSPKDWRTSHVVARALISCPRVFRMARNALRSKGVSEDFVEEVVQDTAVIMQMKVLSNGLGNGPGYLDKISDVYYVIFKVIDLTVRNYQKKRSRAAANIVSNFTSVQFADESHSETLERISSNEVDDGGFDGIHQRLDVQKAQKKLQEKIERLGWPLFIEKQRLLRGRPAKINRA